MSAVTQLCPQSISKRLPIRCNRSAADAVGLSAITAGIFATQMLPWLAACLQYDRIAIADGQLWRLVTGHFVHWNFDHLFWDLTAFIVLFYACAKRSLGKSVLCVISSAMTISVCLWIWQPDIVTYRGLSGIDSALFALLAVYIFRESLSCNDKLMCSLAAMAAGGLLAKVGYEAVTGEILFVDSASAGFLPLASAHALGGLVGGLVAMAPTRRLG